MPVVPQQIQHALELNYRNAPPLLTLWRLYRGQRRRLAIALVCFLIKNSPMWAIPFCTGQIVNAIGTPDAHTRSTVMLYVIVLSALILQNMPMHVTFTYFFSKAVRNVQLILRSALVTRLQHLSISFHDDFHGGRMQSKVLRDVEAIENLSRSLFNGGISAIVGMIIAISVIVFRHQWNVLIFFVCTVPVISVLLVVFRRRMRDANQGFRKEIESMSAQVSEMIEMIPVTRAHAAEDREISRLREKLDRVRRLGRKLDITNEAFAASAWSTFQGFSFGCLLFTVYLFMAKPGSLGIGDIMMYQLYFGMLVGSVNGLLMMLPQISSGTESLRSIGEILECPDIELNEGKAPVKSISGRITFENVGFDYPGTTRPAVTGFSLDVTAGECVAIVGESGSGKSTLMNLIIGFRRPTSGRILLDGRDMAELNLRQFRRHIAVVPQNTVLFSGTLRENISYGLDNVRDEDMQTVIEAANVKEFVDKLPAGLDTKIGAHGSKLSGGQRQRIAIARALLRNPRLIILDEATSALDVISEHLVQDALNRLIKGRTTFIVAHRLSTIRHASRIIVMKDGRTVEEGTHDELLQRKEAFWRLKSLQV